VNERIANVTRKRKPFALLLENADEKGMLISFVTAIPILRDAKRGEEHNARFVGLRTTGGRGVFG